MRGKVIQCINYNHYIAASLNAREYENDKKKLLECVK